MHATRVVAVLSDGTEHPIELRNGRGSIELPGTPTEALELRLDGIAGTDPRPFGLTEVTVDADGRTLDLREEIALRTTWCGAPRARPRSIVRSRTRR